MSYLQIFLVSPYHRNLFGSTRVDPYILAVSPLPLPAPSMSFWILLVVTFWFRFLSVSAIPEKEVSPSTLEMASGQDD